MGETLKNSPPFAYAGLTLWGFPLSDWATVVTLIYTLFLVIEKFPVVVTRMKALWRKIREQSDRK